MPTVTVRLYEELNHFLPADRRGQPFPLDVPPGSTTKALIENLGVPHTEVDLVLVNSESVDFSRQLSDGDRSACTRCSNPGTSRAVSRVRGAPLRETRFIADVHLGKLARLLRMMGFDTAWANDLSDEMIARAARAERRIILSRDRGTPEEAHRHARLPRQIPRAAGAACRGAPAVRPCAAGSDVFALHVLQRSPWRASADSRSWTPCRPPWRRPARSSRAARAAARSSGGDVTGRG